MAFSSAAAPRQGAVGKAKAHPKTKAHAPARGKAAGPPKPGSASTMMSSAPGANEVAPFSKRSYPPTLTLDDKDLQHLIDCGTLDGRCSTVTALRQQLDECRKQEDHQHRALADAAGAKKRRKLSPKGQAGKASANNDSKSLPWKPDHVRVHLRNMGGDLLCELNLDLKTLKGMPTVGRLRREFSEHVRKQGEIYEDRLEEIIEEEFYGIWWGVEGRKCGGEWKDDEKFTFRRSAICTCLPRWGGSIVKNSRCFAIPDATFHASSSLGFEPDRPFVGEFFFEGRFRAGINCKSQVRLLVRDPNHDPEISFSPPRKPNGDEDDDENVYLKRMMILPLRRSGKFPLGLRPPAAGEEDEDWIEEVGNQLFLHTGCRPRHRDSWKNNKKSE